MLDRHGVRALGLGSTKDAEIVVVGSDGPRLDLLLDERRVDVAIMHAPEPFQAAKRGWAMVEDLGRLDVAFQNSCAATTRRLMRQRPDTALRYVRAYCRGVYRFRTDAEFGVAVLRKYTGETEPTVLEQTWLLFARLDGRDDVSQCRRHAHREPRAGRAGRDRAADPARGLDRRRRRGGRGARGLLRDGARARIGSVIMKAAVLEAYHRPLVVREVELAAPARGEVAVEVKACGLCLTDVHISEGKVPTVTLPLVPGHELCRRHCPARRGRDRLEGR